MRQKLAIGIISSLFDFRSFKYVLSRSPLIGDKAAVVALALPITAGLFYGLLALIAVYTLYLAYVICFTPQLVCPCGGVLKRCFGLLQKQINLYVIQQTSQ